MFRTIALLFFLFLSSFSADAKTLEEILAELRTLVAGSGLPTINSRGMVFRERLGEGAYGVIFRVEYGGQSYAFKIFKRYTADQDGGEKGATEALLLETQALLQARGAKYLMQILGVVSPSDSGRPGILLPLKHQNLEELIATKACLGRRLDEKTCSRLFYSLARGVQQLNQIEVIHCDLKPANIMLDERGMAVIGDFSSTNQDVSSEICTLWYRAPELILRGGYSSAIMIFSLGCIFYECLTGRPLFESRYPREQLYFIYQLSGSPSDSNWPAAREAPGYPPEPPAWGDERHARFRRDLGTSRFVPLLLSLMALDPNDRPTADQLVDYLADFLDDKDPVVFDTIDGLKVVNVVDDGDCGFHAVSASLGRDLNRADFVEALRRRYQEGSILPDSPLGEALFLAIHNAVSPGVPSTQTFEVWLNKIAGKMWLSHADLAVLAYIYNFTLVIHTPGLELQTINPGQAEVAHIGHVGAAKGKTRLGPGKRGRHLGSGNWGERFVHYVALVGGAGAAPVAGPTPEGGVEESPAEAATAGPLEVAAAALAPLAPDEVAAAALAPLAPDEVAAAALAPLAPLAPDEVAAEPVLAPNTVHPQEAEQLDPLDLVSGHAALSALVYGLVFGIFSIVQL